MKPSANPSRSFVVRLGDMRPDDVEAWEALGPPACVVVMACLCAGHARGLDPRAPCQTAEPRPGGKPRGRPLLALGPAARAAPLPEPETGGLPGIRHHFTLLQRNQTP